MRIDVVFESPTAKISDTACEPGHRPQSEVEVEPAYGISFPRRGVYIHETPAGRIVADPAMVVFRSQGAEQITTHPTSEGDANTWIQFPAPVIDSVLDRADRFRRGSAPASDRTVVAHLRLLARARSASPVSLEIEEDALALLEMAHGVEPLHISAVHRDLVADTRELLALSYRENLDLAAIAHRVGSSPFHLSRVFKKGAGMSITRYRVTLRIQHVIDRIERGADDLSALAIEAGFYDHAHMTRTIRQRMGSPPSHLRLLLAS